MFAAFPEKTGIFTVSLVAVTIFSLDIFGDADAFHLQLEYIGFLGGLCTFWITALYTYYTLSPASYSICARACCSSCYTYYLLCMFSRKGNILSDDATCPLLSLPLTGKNLKKTCFAFITTHLTETYTCTLVLAAYKNLIFCLSANVQRQLHYFPES